MLIKDYEPTQFDQLAKMIFSLYEEDPAGEPVTLEHIQRTAREARKKPEKLHIHLLWNESEPVGYAIINFFWSNEHGGDVVNIDEIYVVPEARNQGFGTAFFQELNNLYPEARGFKLEASPSNVRAIAMYRRLGFSDATNLHMVTGEKIGNLIE